MLNRMCNLPQAIQRNALWDIDLWAKQKPHKNAEPTQKHKTLMKVSSHKGDINILAFFQVVASGQISPHFRGAKISKISEMQTDKQKLSLIERKFHNIIKM